MEVKDLNVVLDLVEGSLRSLDLVIEALLAIRVRCLGNDYCKLLDTAFEYLVNAEYELRTFHELVRGAPRGPGPK